MQLFYGVGSGLALLGLMLPVWDHAHRPADAVTTVVIFAVAVWLLCSRRISIRSCHLLCAAGILIIAAMVWSGEGTVISYCYAVFFVWIGVFAGLFFSLRWLVAYQIAGSVALWAASLGALGVGRAVLVTGFFGVAFTSASATIAVLIAESRRRQWIDPDTDLFNGYGLAAMFDRRPPTEPTSLFVLSLDGLADVRQALGYEAARTVLRQVIDTLRQVMPSEAVMGRVAGDELVVMVGPERPGPRRPGVTPGLGVTKGPGVADGLAASAVGAVMTGRRAVDGLTVMVRAHAGTTCVASDSEDFSSLWQRAASATRRGSLASRSAVGGPGPETAMDRSDLELLAALDGAAEAGELWLSYQPQVSAQSKNVAAVEALLRWTSPRYGAVSPERFIPLAERSSLVSALTTWVLGEALDAQVRWRRRGIDIPVAVNISAQALSTAELPAVILAALADRGLPGTCLTVEITETVAMCDPSRAGEWLRPLAEAGIRISIDDFGTGYTSLAALPDLPVSELKVDQRFVRRSAASPADEAIVRTVRELAHRLGFDVVAEGVEDEATGQRLSEFGFDLLQGFHFSKPLAEEALLDYLRRQRVDVVRGARSEFSASPPLSSPQRQLGQALR